MSIYEHKHHCHTTWTSSEIESDKMLSPLKTEKYEQKVFLQEKKCKEARERLEGIKEKPRSEVMI